MEVGIETGKLNKKWENKRIKKTPNRVKEILAQFMAYTKCNDCNLSVEAFKLTTINVN